MTRALCHDKLEWGVHHVRVGMCVNFGWLVGALFRKWTLKDIYRYYLACDVVAVKSFKKSGAGSAQRHFAFESHDEDN